jgi:AraC-like DNA-binding protein
MSSCAVRNFSDPDQLEAAYTAAVVQLTPTGNTRFEARAVLVDFDKLRLRQVYERAPRIKHAAQSPQRAFIRFLAMPGPEPALHGATLPYEGIVRHPQGHSYYERTVGENQWATLSLPVEELVSVGSGTGGCDLAPPRDLLTCFPPVAAMAELRQLHAEVAILAQCAPHVLTAPEVSRALEQSLILKLVGCLGDPEKHETSWAHRCHATVMRRFHNLLEQHPNRALYLPEICAAIKVPERTLRLCCQEHLGMSPKHFLLLRRLHQAHQALRSAISGTTTVTEIATRFGFWHFGRFAGSYQSIFGEAPSVSLRKP